MIEKLRLFESKKELAIFLSLALFVLSINILLKYQTYQKLKLNTIYQTQAVVINQYQKTKHNKSYIVFKLRAKEGFTFYSTSKEDLKDLYGYTISFKMLTKDITFLDLFKGFYAPIFDIWIDKKDSYKLKLLDFISSQHQNSLTKELFLALFLAKPISKELREKISNWGISHLIAISGFHLGVLFFILYFLLKRVYTFFQKRFFPYRNSRFDLTMIILFILFGYLYFLGFIPSLIRSYVMLLVGFFLYDRYFQIISFELLFVAVVLILAFIPEFFFSVAFWFSVSGVFFIYQFLKLFPKLKAWQIFVGINFWVYFMMLPIVHLVFDKFTLLQLFSPILSMLFTIFYPLELFLHLIGRADLLDNFLLTLFSVDAKIYHISVPIWFVALYLMANLYIVRKIKPI